MGRLRGLGGTYVYSTHILFLKICHKQWMMRARHNSNLRLYLHVSYMHTAFTYYRYMYMKMYKYNIPMVWITFMYNEQCTMYTLQPYR